MKADYSLNGFPDLICLKDGKTIFIEIKGTNQKLKPLQEHRLQQLTMLGFNAIWVDSYEGFKNQIKEIG